MDQRERLKKRLQTALKLGGFSVRREFCALIVDRFEEEGADLGDKAAFDGCIRSLCKNLETQCLSERSIELEHIERALEVCVHTGYDKDETVFSVINAFDFPRLRYDLDRKQFFAEKRKSRMLSDADSKAQMYLDRYNSILQRTKRNFKQKQSENERIQLRLQTVDYLLTVSYLSLDSVLILGSLLQVCEGKYSLEDPTGMVALDLTHAKYFGGFFVENGFVLVNGYYEDKILKVSTVVLPPGEEYKDSRPCFGILNYFGGPSTAVLKDSLKLREHLHNSPDDMIMFLSDVWLDNPQVFEKLETLFQGLNDMPPIAFVFMGNFMSEFSANDKLETLSRLFRQLGELITQFPGLEASSQFVFVPGLEDPCITHIVPKLALPSCVTAEMKKVFGKAIFATNPCRIQYCTREIAVFRADVLPKLLQATLHKPSKSEIADSLTKTIISQGHLSPLPLNALTVHWDFDYALRLYPLPDLVVIGDKSEPYVGNYKGCQVINPGSFCDGGFQFKSYVPASGTVEDCAL